MIEDCGKCEKEIRVVEWENGKCSLCQAPYCLDEIVSEDDSWSLLLWEDPWK